MKKTFTFLALIVFCGSLNAQISPLKIKNGHISLKAPLNAIGGSEALSNLITNPNPNTVALKANNTIDDVRIGTTTYDLQSNASVDNRLIRHSNGAISATLKVSLQEEVVKLGWKFLFFISLYNSWQQLILSKVSCCISYHYVFFC